MAVAGGEGAGGSAAGSGAAGRGVAGTGAAGGAATAGAAGGVDAAGKAADATAAGGGTVYAQTNTTQHAGNASGAVVSTMVQLSAGATVYSSMFVPTGFAVGNGTSTWGITNVRMWAIWMTV